MNCLRPWCFIGFLASATACSGAAAIPDTPDLSILRGDYEAPTATLDDTMAAEAINQSPPLSQLAAAFRTTMLAADSAGHAADTAAPQSSGKIRIQGSVHVNLRCPGDLADPVYDANTNGSMSLTIAVADSHVRRDVAGIAAGCVLRASLPAGASARVGLDGPIDFDLGKDLGLGEGWSGQLLVAVRGELSINGSVFHLGAVGSTNPLPLSARFSDRSFQYLHQFPDGKTAVLEIADTGIIIRGQGGTWLCADVQSCVRQ